MPTRKIIKTIFRNIGAITGTRQNIIKSEGCNLVRGATIKITRRIDSHNLEIGGITIPQVDRTGSRSDGKTGRGTN
jgi:hypothetical protein